MQQLRNHRHWQVCLPILALGAVLLVCPAGECRSASASRNSAWAELIDKDFNFYRVAPRLYRSGEFTRSHVAELQRLGILTSIDLREFGSDAEELDGTSIQQIRVRTNTWNIGDRTVITALSAVRRAEISGPVVLHCQHGSDRTGLVVAMYRILYQGWSKEAALDELLHGGYGYHSVWKNIPSYIRNVDVEKIRIATDRELAQDTKDSTAQ